MATQVFNSDDIVKNINEKGWSLAGQFDKDKLKEFTDYIYGCDWYPTHVKGHHTAPVENRDSFPWASISMHDVILAPHWFEMSLQMTETVKKYFATDDIVLYSYNAFYTNPANSKNDCIQSWHVDYDSENFLALFMYLTDVNSLEDGAHLFEEKNGERIKILGPAGTMFFADTRRKHMGEKPINHARGLVWARWSINENPITYNVDCLSPINKKLIGKRYPKDKILQKIIRKVAA